MTRAMVRAMTDSQLVTCLDFWIENGYSPQFVMAVDGETVVASIRATGMAPFMGEGPGSREALAAAVRHALARGCIDIDEAKAAEWGTL